MSKRVGRLLSALREEDLTVVEVDGWRTRNPMGLWGGVHWVMIHHTATWGSAATVASSATGTRAFPGRCATA